MNEGVIIRFKDNSGQIKGDDGNTYAFNRRALGESDPAQATRGRRVRFEPEGDRARNVVLLSEVVSIGEAGTGSSASPAACSARWITADTRSKTCDWQGCVFRDVSLSQPVQLRAHTGGAQSQVRASLGTLRAAAP
jgi:hypothetical protein